MDGSEQFHDPATSPPRNEPPVPIKQDEVGPRAEKDVSEKK